MFLVARHGYHLFSADDRGASCVELGCVSLLLVLLYGWCHCEVSWSFMSHLFSKGECTNSNFKLNWPGSVGRPCWRGSAYGVALPRSALRDCCNPAPWCWRGLSILTEEHELQSVRHLSFPGPSRETFNMHAMHVALRALSRGGHHGRVVRAVPRRSVHCCR